MNRAEFVKMSLLAGLIGALTGHANPASAAARITAAQFVEQAGSAGNFEIASSEIAAGKAKDVEVKAFAVQMIKDHRAAARELKSTAGSKYKVPTQLDAQGLKLMDELKSESHDIDAVYVKMQVEAHEQAVELFTAYGKQGDDPALRAFAVKMLPILQMHYEMIKKINTTQA